LISVRSLQRSEGDVSDPIKYIYSWSPWRFQWRRVDIGGSSRYQGQDRNCRWLIS